MWKRKSYNELTTEEIIGALSQLRQIGVRRIGFSGGEALLREDLPYLIRKARELGFEHIRVLTNGLLLRKRAKELLQSGLNGISLSLDGPEEEHDNLRGITGYYKKCYNGLEELVRLRDYQYSDIDITIVTTLMKPVLRHLSAMIDLCIKLRTTWFINLFDTRQLFFFKDIDAQSLTIKEPSEINEAIDELHFFKKKYPKFIHQTHFALEYARIYYLKDAVRRDIPCTNGYLNVYIDALGNVYSGCWVFPPLGNLRKKRLSEIVFSDEYKQRIRKMFRKECPGCNCAYDANLWCHLPSDIQNVVWSLRLKFEKGMPCS